MKMLSKEECEKALLILKQEYDVNPYVIVLFEDLINEHFELVEEYKDTRKELDCYYEMMYNPQPYKFEDLKDGLWVWDRKENKCNKIIEINNGKIEFYYVIDNATRFTCEFKENRFFPVQMANGDYEFVEKRLLDD